MSQDHISIFESSTCEFTEQEQRNLEIIRGYRDAKVSERAPFMHPDFERIRAGFKNIGELWGGGGMTDESIPDRENILLELTAKGDRVWGIWRVVGTHGGELYGIPATNRHVDAIEVGLWRIEDGLIREAWYFGDDLGLIRQIGVEIPSE